MLPAQCRFFRRRQLDPFIAFQNAPMLKKCSTNAPTLHRSKNTQTLSLQKCSNAPKMHSSNALALPKCSNALMLTVTTHVTVPMHDSNRVLRVESSRVEVQLELDLRSPSQTRLELDSREETREDSSLSFELKNPDLT